MAVNSNYRLLPPIFNMDDDESNDFLSFDPLSSSSEEAAVNDLPSLTATRTDNFFTQIIKLSRLMCVIWEMLF